MKGGKKMLIYFLYTRELPITYVVPEKHSSVESSLKFWKCYGSVFSLFFCFLSWIIALSLHFLLLFLPAIGNILVSAFLTFHRYVDMNKNKQRRSEINL